jgi:transcriptional regulator with GAF, ATPase, and Fis domain
MDLPARYEPLHRLGAGGGGEVWSVRDRVTARVVALKVLAAGAGEGEIGALVREAVALSGLEGLGLPRVLGFGALAGGRRYMVREIVEGRSLEQVLDDPTTGGAWVEALVTACDELTVVHRAGLLHGDLKPGNIIVRPDGRGTLVDLGLAAPWREGGTAAQGLTPKYAAPELFQGSPLTVRAEVYALGVTLAESLARRPEGIDPAARQALTRIAARATERNPGDRWPSVDELASAIRSAARLPTSAPIVQPPWPVVGLDAPAMELHEAVRRLAAGEAIAVEGPAGSGRTTLVRRLAWTLGVEGSAVAAIEHPSSGLAMQQAVDLELAQHATPPAVIVVDDGDRLDDASRAALRRAAAAGSRLVVVASRDVAQSLARGEVKSFPVPPLEAADAQDLVRRAVPSLSETLSAHLVSRIAGRPGALRRAVRLLSNRAIVSREDIDNALGAQAPPSVAPASSGSEALDQLDRALDTGRFDDAAQLVERLADGGMSLDPRERVRVVLVRARIAIGRGDTGAAQSMLADVADAALDAPQRRLWQLLSARAALRAGDYAGAASLADQAAKDGARDGVSAEALSVKGVALALTGEDAAARLVLDDAIRMARATGETRVEAVALGSAAIAHQRAGRAAAAHTAYEASLAAAEKANDAATVATTRLNLAGVAQSDGELAEALAHLDAAIDMGRRSGSRATVTQALLNRANLDLYLGRWARARGSIDELVAQRAGLPASARAQLLGLEAELAARTGDAPRASRLYEETAAAYAAQGRPHDAAESRLEGLLVRARAAGESPTLLGRELEAIRAALGEAGFGEHGALAELLRGTIALRAGSEEAARRALDLAVDRATKEGRREWAWQALDARARLSASQGGAAMARRDAEAALATLEETAAKLPRDLREVFWNDPRRRGLREAHAATIAAPASVHAVPSAQGAGGRSSGNTSLFTGPRLAEDRLARILEITRELAVEHDVPRLLERVTDHAIALLAAERGFVLLVGDRGELEAQTARDRSGGDDPHGRFSRSVAERVFSGGEPVVTISARDDTRLAEAVSVHQLMIQSIACVPIRGAPPLGKTIGVLYVETRLRAGVRFEQELPTLLAFADQAAIAIENARLLGENKARAEELSRANADLASARDDLARALGRRTEQLAEARRDLKQVRAELRSHFGYAGLIGTSAAMRRVYAIIDRVRDTDIPVLLTGESGTGKEVVAKAIHQAGLRAKKPFIGVNCGAIPANLLESELFGNVRGAFTGADRDRRGLFREAEGGTLLLDEIGEMPLAMQAGLLRVLEEKRVRPLGSANEEPVDVRIIAATHRDLAEMVAAKSFREDLFYRLHVVEIRVPPLRDRVEDIPPLLDHFLSLFAARYRRDRKSVSREALRALCAQPWPGNVRQLEHVLLNAWLMSDQAEIAVEDFELPSTPHPRATEPVRPPRRPTEAARRPETDSQHRAAERERILGALTACNWNRVQAAKMIGLPRRTFYRRLKEFGIL